MRPAPSRAPAPCRAAVLLLALPLLALACARAEVTDAPASAAATTPQEETTPMPADNFYALSTRTLDGEPAELSAWQGEVSLVVNVASECGLTPQYAGLQELHEELSRLGLNVLGFPSNDFGGQEPGSPKQIQQFCTSKYSVTFPLFEKVQTKAGEGQSPIYARLQSMTGELPSWNFSKYLVSKDGTRATFFGPRTEPHDEALRAAIEAELAR